MKLYLIVAIIILSGLFIDSSNRIEDIKQQYISHSSGSVLKVREE